MSLVPYVDPDAPVEGEFVVEPPGVDAMPEPTPADAPLSISFIATLAGVNTAAKPVNFDIDGAAKLSFETDETQTPYVVALLALKRARLHVTVTVDMSANATPATGEVSTGKRKRKAKKAPVEA